MWLHMTSNSYGFEEFASTLARKEEQFVGLKLVGDISSIILGRSEVLGIFDRVARILPLTKHVQYLALRDCIGGAIGVSALSRLLATEYAALKWLNLSSNRLTSEDAEALGPVFAHCPSLTKVNLQGNMFLDAGVCALVPSLLKCKSLNNLNLGFNDVGALGMRALATVLVEN